MAPATITPPLNLMPPGQAGWDPSHVKSYDVMSLSSSFDINGLDMAWLSSANVGLNPLGSWPMQSRRHMAWEDVAGDTTGQFRDNLRHTGLARCSRRSKVLNGRFPFLRCLARLR